MPLPIGTNRKVIRNRCVNLRWKGLYIESSCEPENHFSNDSAIWCFQTYKCVGPDGQIVDEFECNPARPCYEPL